MSNMERGALRFKFPFRSHQTLILDRFELERRQTPPLEPLRYHVVAPPGAGKTIVGIEMAIRLGDPCMVVCPNTAIQGQWAKKLDMFVPGGHAETAARLATTDASHPRWLTVLTYQILSIPEDPGEGMVDIAEGIWAELLTEGGLEEEEATGAHRPDEGGECACIPQGAGPFHEKGPGWKTGGAAG
jgi:hypothetical protein